MKQTIQNSFYQLLTIYTILVLLISLNLFWKYSLQMSIFAIIVAILGISTITKEKPSKPKKIHIWLFILAIITTIALRVIPYLKNQIPLGYDAGIYKYAIESGLSNADKWIVTQVTMEPFFLYLMEPLKLFFSSQTLLTYGFIAFCLILGLAIYLTTKEYFNKTTAIIAFLIYSVSIIQFLTFNYMYYRNVIGLTLALFSIYFLKKSENNPKLIYLFILLGALTGATHRPTFYIFGLSYLAYALTSPYKDKYNFNILKKNIINGILILVITSLFYLGRFKEAIFSILPSVFQGFIQTGQSPGTFINFLTYQYSTLAYLPFALLGLFTLIKNKKLNILFFWTIITAIIVYFQFFFYNRFIIHLDIALIILAAYGFSIIIKHKKKLGIIILILMLFSAAFVTFNEATHTYPEIKEELQTIEYLNNTEENAYVMATSSIYSLWVLGYSNRKTIAPGLFDYNQHNEAQWNTFWTTTNINEIKTFLDVYEKPLYIFIGQKQKDNLAQFNTCFEIYKKDLNNKIYKYTC
ncbi:MAG: glycosyltransferase family 39 protein [Nanoarchaeota archaeon]|nr:EpsG family protein [Nanoarchaeota archaeon]MBU1445542.1 EpsG family protein [Nanoarchaeota archaeon]MBU2420641.1 EpsG family protein [Nanoarchaeota archaeon]MBU2474911.1 EpsG family protein [Nanoarchaeota archaeon]